jgi:hypothetical protein
MYIGTQVRFFIQKRTNPIAPSTRLGAILGVGMKINLLPRPPQRGTQVKICSLKLYHGNLSRFFGGLFRGLRPAGRRGVCGIRFWFPICACQLNENGSRLIGRILGRRAICAGNFSGFSLLHPLLLVLCCGNDLAAYLYTKYTPAGVDLFVKESLTFGYL